jgi:hypothetical protein
VHWKLKSGFDESAACADVAHAASATDLGVCRQVHARPAAHTLPPAVFHENWLEIAGFHPFW